MLRTSGLWNCPRRWKSKKVRWNIQERKKQIKDRALENFDDFYGSVYGIRWKNMRVALLTEHKYIAMVNNFGDTDKTKNAFELDGALNIKSLVNLAKERLNDGNSESMNANKNAFKLGEKLLDITKRQQVRERQVLYPEEEENNLLSRETTKLDDDYNVDAKKSLETSLEEDRHIDMSRLVDPEMGTGGLYEYMPASQIKGMEDWIPESEHYKFYQVNQTDFPFKMEMDKDFIFPENLNLYTYEMGNCSDFKSPRKSQTGVLTHYLMDGASILPPLFLNIQNGDRVLDACAAPGGKSMLMLQTLHPRELLCNDLQESRVNRLKKVMEEYLFNFQEHWEGKRVFLNGMDARSLDMYDCFDKILVDVPCTTDRHSVKENDNLFKPTRIKERLKLPELQAGILENCLRLLKPGGTLVYSTCSLSPVQNDGVVHMALHKVFNDYGITVKIHDLSSSIQYFNDIFKFEYPRGLKYGQMVVPYLPANFGPMYFSKITRET